MCNFLVGLILMILPLGFIVDEVAKEFENVIFIVWNFVLNWRFKYINDCIYIVCENVWMIFYFYVFLFFVCDFSKACMIIPFAFAVRNDSGVRGIGERNYFGSFFVGSQERDWKQEDSMTYLKSLHG